MNRFFYSLIFTLIFIGTTFVQNNTNAQTDGQKSFEVVQRLGYNPVLAQQKINRNILKNTSIDDICETDRFDIEIVESVEPECQTESGTITVEITSPENAFTFYLNGELIGTGSGPDFTFENLGSGPHLIQVDTENGRSCSVFTTLNDADTEPLNPDAFVFEDAFCGLGKIRKGPIVVSDFTDFAVYDENDELVQEFSIITNSIDLEPGNYYVRKQTSVECKAFIPFTIEKLYYTEIPFLDDFSTTLTYPDRDNWEDKQAFVNRSFAVNPITLGVATLDGLDEFGQPYQASQNLVDGPADSLTSNPFCLGEIVLADGDSMYLSFLFQPEGISDNPNQKDSLFVDVKDSNNDWHNIWSINGTDPSLDTLNFHQVILALADDTASTNDATFFFDGFQFRFRNTATITGLNDPWHIDYVSLDTNIPPSTPNNYNDLAFVYDIAPLLQRYSAMPWDQFYNYQDTEFIYSIRFSYRINSNDPGTSVNLGWDIYELCDSIPIESDSLPGNIPGGQLGETNYFSLGLSDATLPDLKADKDEDEDVIVRCDLNLLNTNDSHEPNDVLFYNQIFSNYFAYDDGTAERAYGLLGAESQLAIEYELNKPTELVGVQIYFTHIVGDVGLNTFSIKAWSAIDNLTDGEFAREDTLIASKEGLTPLYTGVVGGFATYLFDEAVPIDGTFFIGMEQDQAEILNIGLDVNNVTQDTCFIIGDTCIASYSHIYAEGKTFYNSSSVWLESTVAGAVMIRPIVAGKDVWATGLDDLQKEKWSVNIYPNPANTHFEINAVNLPQNYNIQIFDNIGREISRFTGAPRLIDINDLSVGMYILKFTDEQGQTLTTEKLIKY